MHSEAVKFNVGVRKQKLSPKEAIGRWVTGSALSAVAMAPGFVLDRLGLIMLGLPHLHLLGFVVLSVGAALYAAGLSSVKAVKLSMKLDQRPDVTAKHSSDPGSATGKVR